MTEQAHPTLRQLFGDDQLRRIILDELDCCYLREPGGLAMRAWLMEMRRVLASA